VIIVAGTIGFASQEQRDAAVAASIDLQRATRNDEPGCLAYSFGPDAVEATVVVVYELWSDARALAAHFEHPNYAAMRQVLRSFERSGPSHTTKYRIDATAPVYSADGLPNADFAS
jgi:quinol monooxygenase YgiN